ncbi:MAG: YybS family protein [candidate division Zixibacteria bacterium]|nr:YybS family protein [candidate division Zixibacteria bacterium]MBU1472044.1 YybS family protein [candidate division Zixibacteria bacterium]MBU2626352.1 YybS family protein [candidate division Zixibacteria bacterium]
MTSAQIRLSWTAVGMVVSYNLFCWLPASIWAFTIIASTALVFLFAVRPYWIGSVVAVGCLAAGILTARFMLDGYLYYFIGFASILVILPALLMAIGNRRGLSAYKTQLIAIVPVSIVMVLYLGNIWNAASSWKEILGVMSNMATEWNSQAFAILPSSLSPEEMMHLKESVKSFFDLFYRFSPGLVICWAAAMNIAAYFFAGKMIRKDGGFHREFRGFIFWKIDMINMVLLGAGILIWLIELKSLMPFAENLLFILAVSYMVAGLALIEFYMKRLRIHTGLRIAIYLVLFVSGWIGGLIAVAIGLVDSQFDFRRVRAQQIG